MARIRWTDEAEKWLRDIHNYIAQDNPTAAQKIVSAIYEKAQLLKNFPEIGYKYKTEPEGRYGFFYMVTIELLISSETRI